MLLLAAPLHTALGCPTPCCSWLLYSTQLLASPLHAAFGYPTPRCFWLPHTTLLLAVPFHTALGCPTPRCFWLPHSMLLLDAPLHTALGCPAPLCSWLPHSTPLLAAPPHAALGQSKGSIPQMMRLFPSHIVSLSVSSLERKEGRSAALHRGRFLQCWNIEPTKPNLCLVEADN